MKLLRKDLVTICSLDRQGVGLWKKLGLRVDSVIRGKGSPAELFDSDDVLKFLEGQCVTAYQTQKIKYHQRLLRFKAYLKAAEEVNKKDVKPAQQLSCGLREDLPKKRGRPRKTDTDLKPIKSRTPKKGSNGEFKIDPDSDINEIIDMLNRVRQAESESHKQWQESSEFSENAIQTLNLQKIWMEFISNRTKLEKQIPEILLSKKLYRPISEIKQNCARIGTIFKNNILGTGSTVRAQISALVKSPQDAVLIEGIIMKINKEALRKTITDLGKA